MNYTTKEMYSMVLKEYPDALCVVTADAAAEPKRK